MKTGWEVLKELVSERLTLDELFEDHFLTEAVNEEGIYFTISENVKLFLPEDPTGCGSSMHYYDETFHGTSQATSIYCGGICGHIKIFDLTPKDILEENDNYKHLQILWESKQSTLPTG